MGYFRITVWMGSARTCHGIAITTMTRHCHDYPSAWAPAGGGGEGGASQLSSKTFRRRAGLGSTRSTSRSGTVSSSYLFAQLMLFALQDATAPRKLHENEISLIDMHVHIHIRTHKVPHTRNSRGTLKTWRACCCGLHHHSMSCLPAVWRLACCSSHRQWCDVKMSQAPETM